MKNHSKVGKKPGRPTYRTQDSFKFRKYLKIKSFKVKTRVKKKLLKNKAGFLKKNALRIFEKGKIVFSPFKREIINEK